MPSSRHCAVAWARVSAVSTGGIDVVGSGGIVTGVPGTLTPPPPPVPPPPVPPPLPPPPPVEPPPLVEPPPPVVAVVPPPVGQRTGTYLKLERRVGDFATVGVAVSLEHSGGRVVRAGIALTGVGPATINAADAADVLVGKPLSEETVEQAARLAAEAAQPQADHRGSVEYKRHVVATFVRRGLARGEVVAA